MEEYHREVPRFSTCLMKVLDHSNNGTLPLPKVNPLADCALRVGNPPQFDSFLVNKYFFLALILWEKIFSCLQLHTHRRHKICIYKIDIEIKGLFFYCTHQVDS